MSDGRYETADTMAERVEKNRLSLWFLIHANRLVATAVLAGLAFVAFVVAGQVLEPPFASAIAGTDTIETLFTELIGAIITGVTLVVTIGQVVISQENGPLGDQHRRMSEAMDFRDYLGELIDKPVPPTPEAFLDSIVARVEDRARALRESVADVDDPELRRDVDEFTDSVIDNAREVQSELDGAQFGRFTVLSAALDFNYSVDIYFVEELVDRHGDALDETHRERFDELKTALTMFGPAREHVKTLYFEWELIDLSKSILYAAVPALLSAALMVAFVGSGTFPGSTAGVANILWVTSGAFAVGVVPFLLLAAYILRIVVVAKRTLAMGPLVLRDLDW